MNRDLASAEGPVYSSTYTRVFRQQVGDRPVLLSRPRFEASPLHQARLGHEAELMQMLGAIDEVDPAGGLAIADRGGVPLRQLVERHEADLALVLKVGRSLARTLADLHARRVIHKDINPGNVLVDPTDGSVQLASHALASRLPRESGQLVHPGHLEGELRFISPEQTGRMNRHIDYRTDLYSLGATLYAALLGRPPFVSSDALELVHAHIARAPAAPASAGVPDIVSDLVLRLLAKNAEDRYQSAAGVAADLDRCLTMLEQDGVLRAFPLGERDVPEVFEPPQKLYGRAADLDALMGAFDRAASGQRELLLVSGYSGIGKSALVHEVHKPIVARRGYFVSGKFEQFRRGIPYLGFSEVFDDLVRQILTQGDDEIEAWRERIQEAVGSVGQIVVDLVPSLALVLGPQAPVPRLDAASSDARLAAAFKHFVAALAAEQPLVIFLDDLQWGDAASLALINTLMGEDAPLALLLIGAYRDNEVDPAHPLMLMLADLPGRRSTITLGPLQTADIEQLVADTLRTELAVTAPLAGLLEDKTRGNPFFLLQFFATLFQERLVARDDDAWTWDEAGIRNLESADNVVELMVYRLRQLPAGTQQALRLAACLGTSFDLDAVALIAGSTAAQLAQDLWPAAREGLVLPMLASARAEQGSYVADLARTYRFAHDRVQQAAYALIPEAERDALHLDIGWKLRDRAGEQGLGESIFDIVDHLDLARALVTEPGQRRDLAELNLMAGRRARESSAHASALRYATVGSELLGEEGWSTAFVLTRDLWKLRSEGEYIAGNYEASHAQLRMLSERVVAPEQKLSIYLQKAVMLLHTAEYEDGLRAAIEGLALVGIDVPWHSDHEAIARAIETRGAEVASALGSLDLSALVDLPDATDPVHLAAMDLLEQLTILAYFFNPALVMVATHEIVLASLEKGNSKPAASAYASHAAALGFGAGQYEAGHTLGRVGLALSQQLDDGAAEAKGAFWYGAMVSAWNEPVETSIALHKHGTELGIRVGAPVWAAYNAFFVPVHTRFSGAPLPEAVAVQDRYLLLMESQSTFAQLAYRQLMRGLLGELAPGPGFDGVVLPGSGEVVDEARYVELMHEQELVLSRQHYFNAKLAAQVIWNEPGSGLETVAAAAAEGDMGTILFAQLVNQEFCFHHALAMAGAWTVAPDDALVDGVEANLDRLAVWAGTCPENFQHHHLLVAAERARIKGQALDAMRLYDEAIDAADKHRFPNIAALAAERASRFYLAAGRHRIVGGYLEIAHDRYAAWGAVAKCRALVDEFPGMLAEAALQHATQLAADDLDVATVVKAFQAISQEIELDRLLERLLAILVENAGARRGFLLLETGGQLRVEAAAQADGSVERVQAGAVSDQTDLPAGIVALVSRTAEALVIDDASLAVAFQADAEVQTLGRRSVMCVPIVHQGRVRGLVYLDNDLVSGAFTPGRLRLVQILSAQAAISIENAKLFEEQRAQSASFSRFVPVQFLEALGRHTIHDVRVGDAVQRDINVLFGDLRDFTTISESLGVQGNFEWLNAYLAQVDPVIQRHAGFIDKFIGDAVMALFPGGSADAVQAAVDLQAAVRAFNSRGAGQLPVHLGIGIHRGPLMLGTVGSSTRMDTTVIGDTVNLAARLEGLTKLFQTSLLISEETRRTLPPDTTLSTRVIGRIRVKGKTEPTTVYEVLDAEAEAIRDAKLASLERYRAATALYFDRRFLQAASAFAGCLEHHSDDVAARRFLTQCLQHQQAPPKADWDGSESLVG